MQYNQLVTWNILFTDPIVLEVTEAGKEVWIQWRASVRKLHRNPSGFGGKAIPSVMENYMLNPWGTKNYLNHGAPNGLFQKNFLFLGGFYWTYQVLYLKGPISRQLI